MKLVWLSFGHLFLLLGIIGVVAPVLPTTPFLLLAAVCYSRGSKHFEHWLLHHPHLGPPVQDWRERGVVRPRAKLIATIVILASSAYSLLFTALPLWTKAAIALLLAAVLTFLLTRPGK